MGTTDFRTFFAAACGSGRKPYPYQERFAEAEELPHLVRAPTGAGKTATAAVGWLWRFFHSGKPTPRRLVYCLPMRVLVEQSAREIKKWIQNINVDVPVNVLMGGVDTDDWYLHPEKPAVLIGTQDMLLSRALNRGYAASRFHWPIDFALLNNDCLWVFDEPQLMGSGVSTSAQLAGLRQALGTARRCPSVWMSATLEPSWLDTIDFRGKLSGRALELEEDDYSRDLPLLKRMTAVKVLAELPVSSSNAKEIAAALFENHVNGTQTLAVFNTVERAKGVYAELVKLIRGSASLELLLIHSRFRAHERQGLNEQLQKISGSVGGRIIVATQVVEAGVDISSRTLVTELAPWASIVQRIGRCNRNGDDAPARVLWIDLSENKLLPPYSAASLDFARAHLKQLEAKSVSPRALDMHKRENEDPDRPFLPFEHKHVLRRRDLLELFDTSPDLSGNDVDVARFVRGDDPDTDVQVFWRDTGLDGWYSSPHRDELCNVPIGSAKAFLKKHHADGLLWDHIDEEWRPVRDPDRELRPGLVILLPTTIGGYSDLGWDPDSRGPVSALPSRQNGDGRPEGFGSDPNSSCRTPCTLSVHTQDVCEELAGILSVLSDLPHDESASLALAARWHDVGKAHAAFQAAMRKANPSLDPSQFWAKSGTDKRLRHGRRRFRHELASALACLQQGLPFPIAYLVGSHHGRVRMAIRPMPGEDEPADADRAFALGVHDGDPLPTVELGNDQAWQERSLDLTPMQLGGDDSWSARALQLLADVGPFALAYRESLLRAADVSASRKEGRT